MMNRTRLILAMLTGVAVIGLVGLPAMAQDCGCAAPCDTCQQDCGCKRGCGLSLSSVTSLPGRLLGRGCCNSGCGDCQPDCGCEPACGCEVGCCEETCCAGKICQKVCATKKIKVVCWGCRCHDICLASRLDFQGCPECTCGPESPCAEVRTKKILTFKVTEIEVPVVKWELIDPCAPVAAEGDAEDAPTEAPEPPEAEEEVPDAPPAEAARAPALNWQSQQTKKQSFPARMVTFLK